METMNSAQSDSDLELSDSVDVGEEESDASSSSESSSETSSSSSSSSSSLSVENDQHQLELELDALESAKITDEVLQLPRGLCEYEAIFRQFFSMEMWNFLPQDTRLQLADKLPDFSKIIPKSDVPEELEKTVRMLFANELKTFGISPLEEFQQKLEAGHYRPDVVLLRQSIAKSRRRERRFRTCDGLSKIAKQLFLSRERLLRIAYKAAPDPLLGTKADGGGSPHKTNKIYNDTKFYAVRGRKRFYVEISEMAKNLGLQDELSANEEEDEDAPSREELLREAMVVQNAVKNVELAKSTPSNADKFVFSTLYQRRRDVPDDEAVRFDQHAKRQKLSNRNFRQHLLEHRRRKLTEPNLPEFETSDIRLRDVCTRAQMGGNFKRLFATGKAPGRRPKSKLSEPPALVPIHPLRKVDPNQQDDGQSKQSNPDVLDGADSECYNILDNDVDLQQEEVVTFGGNACEEGSISSFEINNEVILSSEPEETRVTRRDPIDTIGIDSGVFHQSAFSTDNQNLSNYHRDDFPSLSKIPKLEPLSGMNKLGREMMTSPVKGSSPPKMTASAAVGLVPISVTAVSPTNSGGSGNYMPQAELIQETHACFFSLIRDFFCATPNHRMRFDDLKYKMDTWLCNPITALNDWYSLTESWSTKLTSAIGFLAGDFSDLPEEYVPYIEHKAHLNIYQWIGAGRDSDARLTTLCNFWMQHRNMMSERSLEARLEKVAQMARRRSLEADEGNMNDGGITPPPPPRFPTAWTVRAATTDEVLEFQRQERERFENPHRAYTYRMHGYESVVGPVKGIYSQISAMTKARGHSMMIGDRPNFVTILTLVRDATARLPNGEGTRADISELLKCSQYINCEAAENVLQTIVSGALDRMHTEHDPCVRYDPKRKIWIYLHRNRSEEEFEQMHQQFQGLGKHKKPINRKQKPLKSSSKDSADGDLACPPTGAGSVTFENVANAVATGATPAAAPIVRPSTINSLPGPPALVPASASPLSIAHKQQQQPQQQQPPLPKYPPVPPLKYNIPAKSHPQQQKSLLKASVRQSETKNIDQQKQVQSKLSGPRKTIAAQQPAKQFTFSIPQAKTVGTSTVGGGGGGGSSGGRATPIVVATPSGLQTVHMSNAATQVTASIPTMSATVGGKKVALNKPIIINQHHSAATGGGGGNVLRGKSPTIIGKTQQQQQHHHQQPSRGLILTTDGTHLTADGKKFVTLAADGGIAMTTNATKESTRNMQGIIMDNSQILAALQQPSTQQQTTSHAALKNIIRLVPTISGGNNTVGGVKSLITATPLHDQSGALKQHPVQIIGQRVIATNATATVTTASTVAASGIRQQIQQKSTVGGISIISSNAAGGGNIVKMTPQAFAALQQKQGQHHLIVKQVGGPGGSASGITVQQQQQPQQQQHIQQHQLQRVVVGNTAILTQPMSQGNNQKVVVQQMQVSTIGQKTGVANSPMNKIQTVNAANLTPQQQRVLLQNLKQQQHQQQQQQPQQIQFKTVQVVASQSGQHQSPSQLISHSHLASMSPRTSTAAVQTTTQQQQQQQSGKTVAVVVSQQQPQGVARILKTVGHQSPQHQSPNDPPASGGTRILSNSTGQIISLETLLQKQGGSLKITSAGSGTANKPQGGTSANILQLAPAIGSTAGLQTGAPAQYAVVSQSKNIISVGMPQRLITSQAGGNEMTMLRTTASGGGQGTMKTSGGRIVVSSSGQLQHVTAAQMNATNAVKLIGNKNLTMGGPTAAGTNIRVINASGTSTSGTSVGTNSFNVASIQPGKQVLFTTTAKPAGAGNVKNITTITASQAQQLHSTGSIVIGGQTLKIQGNPTNVQQLNKCNLITPQSSSQVQTVIMGNQILKVQQMSPTIVKSSGPVQTNRLMAATGSDNSASMMSTTSAATSAASAGDDDVNTQQKTLVINSSGQAIRLQPTSTASATQSQRQNQQQQQQAAAVNAAKASTSSSTSLSSSISSSSGNRMVLAVQQGGNQIILSPNFQGGTLNLKSLQNIKLVSVGQQTGNAASPLSGDTFDKLAADPAGNVATSLKTSGNV